MSTDFTLYALDEADLPMARILNDANLAAVTRIGVNGMMAALAQRDAIGMDVFAVYDRPSFRVEEHTTLHEEQPCLSHDLVSAIGHDFPVIDAALIRTVIEVWERHTVASAAADRAASWLEGARGRRLWFEFV